MQQVAYPVRDYPFLAGWGHTDCCRCDQPVLVHPQNQAMMGLHMCPSCHCTPAT